MIEMVIALLFVIIIFLAVISFELIKVRRALIECCGKMCEGGKEES